MTDSATCRPAVSGEKPLLADVLAEAVCAAAAVARIGDAPLLRLTPEKSVSSKSCIW